MYFEFCGLFCSLQRDLVFIYYHGNRKIKLHNVFGIYVCLLKVRAKCSIFSLFIMCIHDIL